MTQTPDKRDLAMSLLGESFHTAFRKATGAPQSGVIHRAITDMPEPDWEAVLAFVVDGLDSMGYEIIKKADLHLDHPHEKVDALHTCGCEKRGYDAALRAIRQADNR
jgi:hypothetical protein